MKILPLEFEINPQLLDEGLTQSEMQTWDNCPEKWYLGYNLMLHKIGRFAWPLQFGTWMHGGLQQFYASKGKRWALDTRIPHRQFIAQEELSKEEYWRGVADTQMHVYSLHYKHDMKIVDPVVVEEVVDVVVNGIRLKGMIDMYGRDLTVKRKDEFFVWDHKTTSRMDRTTVLGWDFRFQFMFYCWMATKCKSMKKWPVAGFMINAIKKPNIQQRQAESLNGFLQRLQIDMLDRPEFYFYRDKLHLKQGDLDHFEQNILAPKLERIKMMFNPSIPDKVKMLFVRNKNTDHCVNKYGGVCEFLPACQRGLEIEQHQYRRREVKHQELITETEE